MKKPLLFSLMILGLAGSLAPLLPASETKNEATVARIRDYVLDPNFKPDGIEKSLIDILDVSLAILPEKTDAGECKDKIAWVRHSFAEGRMFADKIRQYLGLAYQLVSNGAAWKIPDDLKKPYAGQKPAIEQAIIVCGRFLESALAEMKAGDNEKAVGHLLGFVLMVVTPIEA